MTVCFRLSEIWVGERHRRDLGDIDALADSIAEIADPPWEFLTYSDKGAQRSAGCHYDTMTFDDIKALPVETLADTDAALLMWTTWPRLLDALDLIKAWGFTYVTNGFIWIKKNRSGEGLFTGLGYAPLDRWLKPRGPIVWLCGSSRCHGKIKKIYVSEDAPC